MAIGGSRTKVEFGCFTHMRGREGGSLFCIPHQLLL